MAIAFELNQRSMQNQIKTITKREKQRHETATYRTLNIISRRGKAKLARDIKEDTGHKISTAKRSIIDRKASRHNQVVKWNISGKRIQWPGLRAIKRKGKQAGITYLGRGKKRVRKMDFVEPGASKPFLVKGRNSEKNVAVFRAPGYKERLTNYPGHSMPWLMDKHWKRRNNGLRVWAGKELAKEYPKQLEKARF